MPRSAIESRNLADKVTLVAFDSSDAMVEDLREGSIDAMVVQDPRRMGYEAVHTLVQKLRGETPPKRVDLNAVVVRKSDLGKPDIKRLLSIS